RRLPARRVFLVAQRPDRPAAVAAARDDVFLAIRAAVLRREQPDRAGAPVHDGARIAERIRPVVADHLARGPPPAAVMTPPEHEIDVAGVAGAGAAAFGEGEQRAFRREDRRWDPVGVVRAFAGD